MKILIIRLSSIGDIVLTSPVIRCVRQQVPECELHFLTKRAFANVVESNPYLHKVHTVEQNLKPAIEQLRQEQFDVMLDLHNNWRSWRIRRALGVAQTYVFNKLNIAKWIYTTFKINRLPNIHVVERYLQTAESLGVRNDDKGLDYFIPTADAMDMQAVGVEPFQYIAVAVGAAHATKQIPRERLAWLCQRTFLPVVLLGGKGDIEAAQFIEKEVNNSTKLINLCGKISLHQSASVLAQAQKVVAPDTGLMHIAAALRRPIVSVWGNTVPAFGMYPYYPSAMQDLFSVAEVPNLSCRPCSKLGHKACPRKHFNCMQLQDFQGILNKINS